MSMLLIAGQYSILNAAPDGDSIRFYPDNPDEWKLVPGIHRVRTNHSGGAQLRLDGIDALETHYPVRLGSTGVVHQPLRLARLASQELLSWLGFHDVQRAPDETVTSATPQQAPGYILTRTADTYGRCVAFVGRGHAHGRSGQLIRFDIAGLHQSANDHLLSLGLAYPTYYTKLYPDIRSAMTARVKEARTARKGIWSADATTTGIVVETPSTLYDEAVILPKLFRRLADYLALNDGESSLTGFPSFLDQRDDRLFIISTGHATGFDYVVEVDGQKVKLTRPPEDLVFVEK